MGKDTKEKENKKTDQIKKVASNIKSGATYSIQNREEYENKILNYKRIKYSLITGGKNR